MFSFPRVSNLIAVTVYLHKRDKGMKQILSIKNVHFILVSSTFCFTFHLTLDTFLRKGLEAIGQTLECWLHSLSVDHRGGPPWCFFSRGHFPDCLTDGRDRTFLGLTQCQNSHTLVFLVFSSSNPRWIRKPSLRSWQSTDPKRSVA